MIGNDKLPHFDEHTRTCQDQRSIKLRVEYQRLVEQFDQLLDILNVMNEGSNYYSRRLLIPVFISEYEELRSAIVGTDVCAKPPSAEMDQLVFRARLLGQLFDSLIRDSLAPDAGIDAAAPKRTGDQEVR